MNTLKNSGSKITESLTKLNTKKIDSLGKKIQKFLLERDLLSLSLAIYLGTVLQQFLASFVDGLVTPLLSMLIPKRLKDFHENSFLKEHNFNIRKIITNLISLVIAVLLSYVLVRYVLLISEKK